jgi:hypothetical protein
MTPLLVLLGQAFGADLLVPTFTPRSLSDFGPAEKLTEEVLLAVADKDIVFVPPSEIQKRAGEVADGCADIPNCTAILYRHFPEARVAVVGTVSWNEGLIEAKVRFYGPEDNSPIEVIEGNFPESQMPQFAAKVARTSEEVLGLIPQRKAGAVVAAREPGSPANKATKPVERYDDLDQAPNSQGEREQGPAAANEGEEFERRTASLPPRLWERYKESGLPYQDWKEKALVRAGSLIVEIHAGAVFGDVDRVYDTRVSLEQVAGTDDDFEQVGAYQYESWVRGSGFLVGGAVGYAPLWWMEASIFGGVQLGHKKLSIGYEAYEPGGAGDPSKSIDIYSHDPGELTSVYGIIEPRVRLLTLPNGPVKPYLLTGLSTRFYDAYDDPLLTGETVYPKRPGGVSLGVTAGGGIAFDAPKGAVGFIEVPWNWIVSPRPYEQVQGTILNLPRQETGASQTLAFRVGIGFRFF